MKRQPQNRGDYQINNERKKAGLKDIRVQLKRAHEVFSSRSERGHSLRPILVKF